ncbi:MAG: DNA-directed RNA polymerase subunit A'' [Promethearchaeota archaeon]
MEPGEAVGTVAAQSIGEPGTQMSIPGNVKVIISRENVTEIVKIGDFIDELIEKSDRNHVFKDNNSTICDIPENYKIIVPSLNADEKIEWRPLLQVSRHPPNGDLLRVKTRSGREIISTLSHSFIIRKDNEIVPITGKQLNIGDRIPLIVSLPATNHIEEIKLEEYLPKNEFWYGSELAKAEESATRLGRAWKEEYGKTYTVPVAIDALRVALKTEKTSKLQIGFIYPKMHHSEHTQIPETLKLNFLTGWFFGAYLAEGTNTGTYITITNIDEKYRKRAIEFAESIGIHYNVKESEGPYGPSISVNLNSTVLAKLFNRICGKTADRKFVPSWALNAPDNFISGFLQAYFDGDGSFSVERSQIRASSNSRELRDGICLLLSRFGISTSKYEEKNQYNLRISGKYVPIFKDLIGSNIPHKMEALNKIALQEETKVIEGSVTYDIIDMIPGFGMILKTLRSKVGISSKSSLGATIRKITKKQLIGRQTLRRYIRIFEEEANKKHLNIEHELNILKRALHSSVLWDEIIQLELISSPTEYVYDFSVDGLETFTTSEGLITHNTLKTFHYAGAAEFNVTLGLPRLIEIVDARRNPSTPMMEVYLTEKYCRDPQAAKKIAQNIELSNVVNISDSVDIDLATMQIVIRLNKEAMEEKGIKVENVVQRMEKMKKGEVKHSGNIVTIKPKSTDLDKVQKLLEKIKEYPVKGLKGVKRIVIKKDQSINEYVIHTEGTNLNGVLQVKGVDNVRTKCNHIREIAETLGIEACRNAIIREAHGVLDEQGLDVDIRHIMLVSDLMTNSGKIRQIGRHGISGKKSSVLARASFEVTVKHLLEASIQGNEDPLKGITENVIVGQVIPLGTGNIELLVTRPKKK